MHNGSCLKFQHGKRQGDQEFRANFNYLASSKPALVTLDLVSKTKNQITSANIKNNFGARHGDFSTEGRIS